MSYIKFTGEFGKLKSMGFEFQKLYASNYMQWCNDETRVWKKGCDVTMDRIPCEGLFFELYMQHRDSLPWSKPGPFGGTYLRVIYDRRNETVSFGYNEYTRQRRAAMDDPSSEYPQLECIAMTERTLAPLEAFIKLGWVELGEYE